MNICMLGTGLIGRFYTMALQGKRGRDRVTVACAATDESAQAFARQWQVPNVTTNIEQAVNHEQADVVVIALPNHLHAAAVSAAVAAGKPVLCTKPLGLTAAEAWKMLQQVESAGVFAGYLEDLVYTPKTLKALNSVRGGSIGNVQWVRSRETHLGPHSDWFWDSDKSGGGAVIDMGCHCIEIGRSFIGKQIRPVEVVCWADTQVHPIDVEDHAVGMVRYQNGAIGQFEVSWCFHGGMDLRDEVAGTEGTIWLNHWLRTGTEMFSSSGQQDYVAEKSESNSGWLFPVGDEPAALGYVDMFHDMLDAIEKQRQPQETFYDGYVVNAIIDAAYKSAKTKHWEPVELSEWRGDLDTPPFTPRVDFDQEHWLVKREQMPDGTKKLILKNKTTGKIEQRFETLARGEK